MAGKTVTSADEWPTLNATTSTKAKVGAVSAGTTTKAKVGTVLAGRNRAERAKGCAIMASGPKEEVSSSDEATRASSGASDSETVSDDPPCPSIFDTDAASVPSRPRTQAESAAPLAADGTSKIPVPCVYHARGRCMNGESCRFAHGDKELSQVVESISQSRSSVKKTKLCRFHLVGRCLSGPSCLFAHGDDELRGGKEENDAVPAVAVEHGSAVKLGGTESKPQKPKQEGISPWADISPARKTKHSNICPLWPADQAFAVEKTEETVSDTDAASPSHSVSSVPAQPLPPLVPPFPTALSEASSTVASSSPPRPPPPVRPPPPPMLPAEAEWEDDSLSQDEDEDWSFMPTSLLGGEASPSNHSDRIYENGSEEMASDGSCIVQEAINEKVENSFGEIPARRCSLVEEWLNDASEDNGTEHAEGSTDVDSDYNLATGSTPPLADSPPSMETVKVERWDESRGAWVEDFIEIEPMPEPRRFQIDITQSLLKAKEESTTPPSVPHVHGRLHSLIKEIGTPGRISNAPWSRADTDAFARSGRQALTSTELRHQPKAPLGRNTTAERPWRRTPLRSSAASFVPGA